MQIKHLQLFNNLYSSSHEALLKVQLNNVNYHTARKFYMELNFTVLRLLAES